MVSDVWRFCTKLSETHVRCNQCGRIMSYHGTTNLRVHIGRHFGWKPQRNRFGRIFKGVIKLPQQMTNPEDEDAKKDVAQQSSSKNVLVQPVSPPSEQPEVRLCWNSHLTNMQSTFTTLLSQQQFVDVTLACEGRSIKCHKIILSACSSYFEQLLSQNPCKHPIIFLKDMKFWEVEALVDFMYTGEVSVAQEKLPSLLSAAEALQIKGLAGSVASENESAFLPTTPLNLDDHTDESTTSSLTSQAVRKRKSVTTTINHSKNAVSKNRNPFSKSTRTSPEPSSSQRGSSYEPPTRKSKHSEEAPLQLEDIKIEPDDMDTGPIIDLFNIKDIDDTGGGARAGSHGFYEIANRVAEQAKKT